MKGHGYSNDLLEACIRDAKAQGKEGICILCAEGRKREFLADPKFLAYKGFRVADISDKESAQNVPAPVTTYALFRDGQFLTQSIQSDKKFLVLAGL